MIEYGRELKVLGALILETPVLVMLYVNNMKGPRCVVKKL